MTVAIVQGDRQAPADQATMPVTLVLDRLRSAHNTGNIFRLADAVRAERIICCGYTPAPPHPKLEKTAMGADKLIPCETCATAAEALTQLKRLGYTIYGVETAAQARLYGQARFRFPAALVLGNEALGISQEAMECCDEFVCLPAAGFKNSINVGNCAAVVLFEARRQFTDKG